MIQLTKRREMTSPGFTPLDTLRLSEFSLPYFTRLIYVHLIKYLDNAQTLDNAIASFWNFLKSFLINLKLQKSPPYSIKVTKAHLQL